MKNTNYRRKKNYNDMDYDTNPGVPPKEDGKEYDSLISDKSLKNLPHSPISLQVDPYQNALPGSMPYPLLNRFNKIIGGRYNGDKNIDGGTAIQYSNSVNSGFLKIFDTALISIGLNYRYLPIMTSDTDRGNNMVDEMRKAIAEVCSTLAATTFYNQNIYYYAIDTDLPMGSAVKHAVGNKMLYTEIQDVIYAMAIIYQLNLQKITLAFNQFNAFRLKQGEMIRMSFNRETPGLNSFFGLTNKKAFLSLWDSLAYTIEGEYVDTDFMAQTNVLSLSTSRRSNSLNDPLLEVVGVMNNPDNFKMYVLSEYASGATSSTVLPEPLFDINDMKWTNPLGVEFTMDAALTDLAIKCTANDTLKWVRARADNTSDNDRYNLMKNDLDVITHCMTIFKTKFNDLRTVLDVIVRSGMNQWKKGIKLKVIDSTDSSMFQNLVVDNIYQMILSGNNKLIFDDKTKRWSSFSLWNQYYGIPEQDTYSGGVFFTLSTKELDVPSKSTDTNIGYLPIAFTLNTSTTGTLCRIVNRVGRDMPISYEVINGADNRTFARLFPLQSQSSYEMRVPKINLSSLQFYSSEYDDYDRSFAYKFMLQILGVASMPIESDSALDYGLDSDIFCIYDFQITDFTNEVITYSRSKGPFIVNTVDTTNLGFYGMKFGAK